MILSASPLFADAHARHSGVPPLDDLAHAEGEIKRFVSINRGIKLKRETAFLVNKPMMT